MDEQTPHQSSQAPKSISLSGHTGWGREKETETGMGRIADATSPLSQLSSAVGSKYRYFAARLWDAELDPGRPKGF